MRLATLALATLVATPALADGPPSLEVDLGAGLAGRHHRLTAAEGTALTFTSPTPHVAFRLRGLVRPMAGRADRWTEHLRLVVDGRWGLLTSTATEAGGTAQETLATPTSALAAGLGWGARLSEDGAAPVLGLSVRGFVSRYAGPSGDPRYTPISHRGLGLSLWGEWAPLADRLGLRGTFGWRPLARPGAAEADAFGPDARGWGLLAGLEASTTLGPVKLTLYGDYAGFSATYAGAGSRDRDGEGHERTLTLGLMVGVGL